MGGDDTAGHEYNALVAAAHASILGPNEYFGNNSQDNYLSRLHQQTNPLKPSNLYTTNNRIPILKSNPLNMEPIKNYSFSNLYNPK